MPIVFDGSGHRRSRGMKLESVIVTNDIVKRLEHFQRLVLHDSEGLSTGEHRWHHVKS